MPWIPKTYFDFLLEQNVRLQEQVLKLEATIGEQIAASRAHEAALVDRLLTKNGSKPVSAVVVETPPAVTQLTEEQVAFKADWMAEYAEHFALGGSVADRDLLEQKWREFEMGLFDPARPL